MSRQLQFVCIASVPEAEGEAAALCVTATGCRGFEMHLDGDGDGYDSAHSPKNLTAQNLQSGALCC